MSRDIETMADDRAETLVGALEAVAGLLGNAVPGFLLDGQQLAPLLALLASDARAVHESGTLIRASAIAPAPVRAND